MTHFFTRLLSSALCFALAACGFTPMHQALSEQPVQVVHNAQTREEQLLTQALEQQFGTHDNAPYQLHFTLKHKTSQQVVEANREVRRYKTRTIARYRLEHENGDIILKDSADLYGSYDATLSDFGTYMANQDVQRDATESLARTIQQRVTRALLQHKNGQLPVVDTK